MTDDISSGQNKPILSLTKRVELKSQVQRIQEVQLLLDGITKDYPECSAAFMVIGGTFNATYHSHIADRRAAAAVLAEAVILETAMVAIIKEIDLHTTKNLGGK